MKILSAAEMREVDRLTTEQYKIPSLLLMENAAVATVEAVEKRYGSVNGKHALIFCGKGNNGGDGAAIARQLWQRGCRCHVVLFGRLEDTKGDARVNFEIARALPEVFLTSKASHKERKLYGSPRFIFEEVETHEQLSKILSGTNTDPYDYVFDAIFGTGLTRPVTGFLDGAILLLSATAISKKIPLIAVDIPSGLASDSAERIGTHIWADLTVTLTAPKIGNVLPPACEGNGQLVIANIGSPRELIDSSGSRLTLTEQVTIANWLDVSRRSPDANKGDAGKVLIIAGSRGKTGAAALAGEAALRAGAGLVTVATAEGAQPAVAAHLLAEGMTEALADTGAGAVAREAAERALTLAAERDVLALGPGLGAADSTRDFVRAVVAGRPRPLVLDADGLNALAPWPADLRGSDELPIILTPHPGEMARLVGASIPEVLADRIGVTRRFATAHQVILVLKGSRTLVAAPDGEVYVNPTGNEGMATGGTGDVLTGMLAGLLAQRPGDAPGAAIAAVYLHGLAGDLAAARAGTRALVASDITASLGEAFLRVGGEEERPARAIEHG